MYHRHGLCTAITLVLWRGCATICASRSQVTALVQPTYVEQKISSTGILYQRGAPYWQLLSLPTASTFFVFSSASFLFISCKYERQNINISRRMSAEYCVLVAPFCFLYCPACYAGAFSFSLSEFIAAGSSATTSSPHVFSSAVVTAGHFFPEWATSHTK